TNATIPSITVSSSWNYFVTVIDSNGCSATSDTTTIAVDPLPVVNLAGLPDTTCITNGVITLTGTPAGGIYNGAGVNGNVFDPAASGIGSHLVSYSYTDGAGCSDSIVQLIYVDICLGTNNL